MQNGDDNVFTVALIGKLPGAGDFIQAGVTAQFAEQWYDWANAVISGSRACFEPDVWLQHYLSSPIWRFILPKGCVGDGFAYAGFVLPSVDNVGRYFPCAFLVKMNSMSAVYRFISIQGFWFDAIEHLAMGLLEQDSVDREAILETMDTELQESLASTPKVKRLPLSEEDSFLSPTVVCDDAEVISAGFQVLLLHRLNSSSLWWTGGSEHFASVTFIERGLPSARTYCGMISGEWNANSPHVLRYTREHMANVLPREPDTLALHVCSASATHVGFPVYAETSFSSRSPEPENQDAFLDDAFQQRWAVADGMGGHHHGHLASQMVIEALNMVESVGEWQTLRGALFEQLIRINEVLQKSHEHIMGTTIALAALCGHYILCLWIGDSRIYRLNRRGNRTESRYRCCEQLTVDHHGTDVSGKPLQDYVVTRALGVADEPLIDTLVLEAHRGDRLLLCTDGLTGCVTSAEIESVLWHSETPERASQWFMDLVMDRKAKDNVTVIVVDIE